MSILKSRRLNAKEQLAAPEPQVVDPGSNVCFLAKPWIANDRARENDNHYSVLSQSSDPER